MAAIKKRVIAEFTTVKEESTKPKKLRLRKAKLENNNVEESGTINDTVTNLLKTSADWTVTSKELLAQLTVGVQQETIDRTLVFQVYKKFLNKINETKDAIFKMTHLNAIREAFKKQSRILELIGVNNIIDDLLSVAESESSNIAIAEVLDILHCFDSMEIASESRQRIIKCAKNLLQSNFSHLVKNECLILLSEFAMIQQQAFQSGELTSGQMHLECIAIIKLLRDFSHHHDPRVRSTALACILRFHERGLKLDISLYSEFCEALSDDYEGTRTTAVKLLEVLSHIYGDCLVCVDQGDEQIRLADDAFAKICSMMNDPSINVRVQAAKLLGNFSHVSSAFLEQTLEKKLMSNLRKKKSAHERHRDAYESGEWSSGRRWADDAPHEQVCPESINLMNIGACGAFIHGLEDEFYEVRMATLESICHLAQQFPDFANQALDFLVDMFNDEIEEIRLKAIQCLSQISLESIVLRDDQIEIMLAALEDFSMDIREALHLMLGNCKVGTKLALKTCIDNLLENLRRYPQDKASIWNCFQNLGANHPNLTLPLFTDLLGIHPFLDLPEPSLEDNGYVGLLILVFNAAKDCPQMIKFFEKHILRHYLYLHDTYPLLVPQLNLSNASDVSSIIPSATDQVTSLSHLFLLNTFDRVRSVICSEESNKLAQDAILEHSVRDLQRLGEVEPSFAAASKFLCLYLQCQMSLRSILANTNWINTFLLSPLQSSSFRASLQQLLNTTFTLTNRFHGLHPIQMVCIQQTKIKAMALQLIAFVHGSNASALGLCDAFLAEVECLEKLLRENNLHSDSITTAMIKEISLLGEPKPGTVARVLQPLFLALSVSQITDLSMMLTENTFPSLVSLRMSTAKINEPSGKSETPLKFTAGLILSVPFDAIIENVIDIRNIRLKIQYPDQQTHVVLPKLSDFRRLPSSSSENLHTYRLHTNIFLSHSVWTEACHVQISILLDFRDTTSTVLNTSQAFLLTSKANAAKNTRSEDNLIIDLCEPTQVFISPKPPKRGGI